MLVKHLARIVPLAALGLLLLSSGARAQATYHVTTNTTGLSSQKGFLDFQFAKGNAFDSLDAFATLTNVVTDGTLDSTSVLNGAASGILPGPASVGNTDPGGFNDLFQGITFGNTVSFDVTFTGDAVNALLPSSFGSSFAYTLFAGDGVTALNTGPVGAALVINLDPGAQLSAASYAPTTNGGPAVTATSAAPVPELSTSVTLGLMLVLGGIWVARRRYTVHG